MTDSTHPVDEGPEPSVQAVWLVARQEGRELARLRLTADAPAETVIGSDEQCGLRLVDPSVSRRHLAVRLRLGKLAAKDLGSTNGTRYQGSKLEQALLPLGAVLVLGRVELHVEPEQSAEAFKFGALESVAPAMVAALRALATVAPTETSVLLEGPTGTGKDACARALHAASSRAARLFEVVDCGALPKDVAGAELFGSEPGAFTGADRSRPGVLERANGGTLFLDEVGELPLELQPLLLRALEARQVKRLGGAGYRPLDVRVVAATHRELDAEVAAGRFRSDLLHRLAVVRVRLPPLSERLDDLPLLVRGLLASFGPRAAGLALSPPTLQQLALQGWPGNVRELRNFLERALSLGSLDKAESLLPSGVPAARWPEEYKAGREQALDAFERDFARHVLERHEGNVSKAAREAGIGRAYLHRLIKKHGLDGHRG